MMNIYEESTINFWIYVAPVDSWNITIGLPSYVLFIYLFIYLRLVDDDMFTFPVSSLASGWS